ncbi:MAG: hypothetical protein EPN26_12185 [Rhodospirillales bacterium]|nr:MAG: hypothetical protein EPN26_12185 [Rhodospirillales bacterium]
MAITSLKRCAIEAQASLPSTGTITGPFFLVGAVFVLGIGSASP